MSRMASPGVSQKDFIPGGMIDAWTSRAESRMFTKIAGKVMPPASINVVNRLTVTSCGRVT